MAPHIAKNVGQVVAFVRRSNDLSQAALGELLGVDQVEISRIENGKRVRPEFFQKMQEADFGSAKKWHVLDAELKTGKSGRVFELAEEVLASADTIVDDVARNESVLDWVEYFAAFRSATAQDQQRPALLEMDQDRCEPLHYEPRFVCRDPALANSGVASRITIARGQSAILESFEKLQLDGRHRLEIGVSQLVLNAWDVNILVAPCAPFDSGRFQIEIRNGSEVTMECTPDDIWLTVKFIALSKPVKARSEFEQIVEKIMNAESAESDGRPH